MLLLIYLTFGICSFNVQVHAIEFRFCQAVLTCYIVRCHVAVNILANVQLAVYSPVFPVFRPVLPVVLLGDAIQFVELYFQLDNFRFCQFPIMKEKKKNTASESATRVKTNRFLLDISLFSFSFGTCSQLVSLIRYLH